MKRFAKVLITALLIVSGAAGVAAAVPRQQRQQNQPPNPQQQQQNRIQQLIADIYVNRFQNTVGLNDEQFLKVGTFVRQFIQMRFRVANQRNLLNQRRAQLLEQPDPPEAEVRQLGEETAQLERTVGNMESVFVTRIQTELTPRQILLVRTFNTRFFEEELPRLIETARAAQATPARPNAARNRGNAQTTPDATFRGGPGK